MICRLKELAFLCFLDENKHNYVPSSAARFQPRREFTENHSSLERRDRLILVSLLGLTLIAFACLYFLFHFLCSLFNRKHRVFKRIFYPALFGGIFLVALAMLGNENKDFEAALDENNRLKQEITILEEKISTLEGKMAGAEQYSIALEKANAAALSEKKIITEDSAALKQEVARLKKENEALSAERDSLIKQKAANEAQK